VIEIAPLAYMRGRTLTGAFIILDEAQNTTREQMKMFLTRIGENSRTIVTGDITQIDSSAQVRFWASLGDSAPHPHTRRSVSRFFEEKGRGWRNPLVRKIVHAYETGA